jgi:phospholipid/cholesterol/gamma-HCH transport system substrate-binding protein
MSNGAHHFKLGLFVVIAGILLFASLVTLGAGSFLEKKTLVETFFDEAVSGLDVGAPIKYRGVTIGRVNSIGFARAKYGSQIQENTRRLKTSPSRWRSIRGFSRRPIFHHFPSSSLRW